MSAGKKRFKQEKDGFTFINGDSYLVVQQGTALVDMVEWSDPDLPRPEKLCDFVAAIDGWFDFQNTQEPKTNNIAQSG